jgi:N-acetylglutamate synthase-like GNAT family acetyltransferase
MVISTLSDGISIRPAAHTDARMIRKIINNEHLNPMGLHWEHFIIAIDQAGMLIGTGQIKPHSDGTFELASIAVLPAWRGKGIARKIIEQLLERHPGKLYLTCRSQLVPMYQKFGFETITGEELTPYFKRISHLVEWLSRLVHLPDQLAVMRRDH